MARFYQTAEGRPVDYMSRLNTPLMQSVISANDQYISENINQVAALNEMAQAFPHLSGDANDARAITQGYSNQIDAISKAIRDNPASWKEQLGPINRLRNDLYNNYKTGAISKITENYGKVKAAFDYIDERVKGYNKDGKGISADAANLYKQYFLRNFSSTDYDPTTGKYNQISTFNPMDDIDIAGFLSSEMDKIKADKNSYKVDEATGQGYIKTTKNSWEGVTPERILNLAMNRLQDPKLQNFIRERSMIGALNGFMENGKLISPYEILPVDTTAQQAEVDEKIALAGKLKDPNARQRAISDLQTVKEQLKTKTELQWKSNSALSPMLQGIMGRFSYGQTDTEFGLKNDATWNTIYTQGKLEQRQKNDIASREGIAKMNDATRRYIHDNPNDGKSTSKKGSKDGENELDYPAESSVGSTVTNSYAGWNTTLKDGTKVPVLSMNGLSADISKYREQQTDVKNKIAKLDKNISAMGSGPAVEAMKLEREVLQRSLPGIETELANRRKLYELSTEAALNNDPYSKESGQQDLTKEEVALYRKFSDDPTAQGLIKSIENLSKDRLGGGSLGEYSSKFTQWLDNLVETKDPTVNKIRGLRNELTNYLRVKERVDAGRGTYLKNIRKDTVETGMIIPGETDARALLDIFRSNPRGTKIYNLSGESADKIVLDGKGLSWFPSGDNYNMSFTGDELTKYMAENDVKMKIEGIGGTTGIGTGNAVMKVRFFDKGGEIPSTPFFFEVTPDMQRNLASKMATNKNPEVGKKAQELLDDRRWNIRRQIFSGNPSVQKTVGTTNNFEPISKTINITFGDKRIPLNITRYPTDEGKEHIYVQEYNEDGTTKPFTGKQWFNGSEDLIEYLISELDKK